MFETANLRTISRNSRYQKCARTAEPSERLTDEYDVSAIQRCEYPAARIRAL